jgi:hypothetical protein
MAERMARGLPACPESPTQWVEFLRHNLRWLDVAGNLRPGGGGVGVDMVHMGVKAEEPLLGEAQEVGQQLLKYMQETGAGQDVVRGAAGA